MRNGRTFAACLAMMLVLVLVAGLTPAQAQQTGSDSDIQAALGTSFTYQGQLRQGDNPLTGSCDFQFSLWEAASAGAQIGSTLTKTAVSLNDGLFTVQLDFGMGVFRGEARWLAIAVRCPSGSGAYTTLSPRQALTAAPYALALPGQWTQQNPTSPNLLAGFSGNNVTSGVYGATIGGGGASGNTNRVTDNYGTVGGGWNNQAGDDAGTTGDVPAATIGGGLANTASGASSAICGGSSNIANGVVATIGGGYGNTAGDHATVGGGAQNNASQGYATVGGGYRNTAGVGAFVGGGGWNGTSGNGNTASGNASTIGGGYGNTAGGAYAAVGGGMSNAALQQSAMVGGGWGNTASGNAATISGGSDNSASQPYSTVGGGGSNTASHSYAAVGGGTSNTANGWAATVGGGRGNIASGPNATVPGGEYNTAAGAYSFAAGRRAKANRMGCFVLADANDADEECNHENSFVFRATNGFALYTATNQSSGVVLLPGSNFWVSHSDRAAKENFAAVDGRVILDRLANIPIETWSYRSQDPSIRHIGPMAGDFYAAFNVGEDEKYIGTGDADGVALAAIQGLYQLSQERDAHIAQLEAQNAAQQSQIDDLQARLTALERRAGGAKAPASAIPLFGLALGGGLSLLGVMLYQRRKEADGR